MMGVKGDQQQQEEEPRAVGGGEVDDDEWVCSLSIHATQTRLVLPLLLSFRPRLCCPAYLRKGRLISSRHHFYNTRHVNSSLMLFLKPVTVLCVLVYCLTENALDFFKESQSFRSHRHTVPLSQTYTRVLWGRDHTH